MSALRESDRVDLEVLEYLVEQLRAKLLFLTTTVGIGTLDLVVPANNVSPVLTNTTRHTVVPISGLTAGRTVTLPNPAAAGGQTVKVVDTDGSLAAQTVTLTPVGGKTIRGAGNFVMNAAKPGPFGAVQLESTGPATGNNWSLSVFAP